MKAKLGKGKIFILSVSCFLFVSCVTQKKVEYLQSRDEATLEFKEADFPDYRLKPNDELFIQVSSQDEAAASVFVEATNQQFLNIGSIQPYGASLMSYSVDREGYILLPLVGKVLVKEKTVSQVSDELKNSLNRILSQPIVSVKLVNRFISVLGEVNSPGHFPYSQDKLTIFDGLSLAGDITDYGNRKEVILIRNENGINNRINLNLIGPDILASGYYNLRPNDIIYVKPLRNKFWGMRQFPFAVLISALTTGILFYGVVR